MKIKCCGFTRAEDVRDAVAVGVDAIGLNLARGPRKISSEHAAHLVREIPPFVTAVALFVNADEATILTAMRETRCTAIQLHGQEAPELAQRLRTRFQIIKAFAIKDAAALKAVHDYPADAYLLDTAMPGMAGGSGVQWDHHLLTGVTFNRPIILAGGLTPDNVSDAIAVTKPYGVDVASGVESAPGIKDRQRMAALVAACRR